jgi:hypothetical protein
MVTRKTEPDDDEVRKLIRESVQIVREDRERGQYATLHERYGKPAEPVEPGEGDPPPADDPKPEPQAEFGLWGRKKPREPR